MSISPDLGRRIEAVEWFSRIGVDSESNVLPGLVAASEAAAADALADPSWERVTADAASRLTSWLHQNCRSEYMTWNTVVRDAKPLIERSAISAAHRLGLTERFGEVLLDCVRWDLVNAIAETHYAACRPPRFFRDLLTIYEAGNLPCGWLGDWPTGTLLFV